VDSEFEPSASAPAVEATDQTFLVERVVGQLNAVCKKATFHFALAVGKIIVEQFYAGDLGAWRERGPKDASFRKLARHPNLAMGASMLYGSVAIYELAQRFEIADSSRLSTSHLRSVLALTEPEQERLLRAAEANSWSVARLCDEIARTCPERAGNRGGRKRQARLALTLKRLAACLDDVQGGLSGADEPDLKLASDCADQAAALLKRVQDACSTLEDRMITKGLVRTALTSAAAEATFSESAIPDGMDEGRSVSAVFRTATRASILIVEDNGALGRSLSRIASSHGHVDVVGTAREALEALADVTRAWDAIIVDIGLPDGSGLSVLIRFRERFPSARALVLTGECTPDLVNAAFDLRAQFVSKPSSSTRIHSFLSPENIHAGSVRHVGENFIAAPA
jgi:CheY-like chemotaxis protein